MVRRQELISLFGLVKDDIGLRTSLEELLYLLVQADSLDDDPGHRVRVTVAGRSPVL